MLRAPDFHSFLQLRRMAPAEMLLGNPRISQACSMFWGSPPEAKQEQKAEIATASELRTAAHHLHSSSR